MKNRLKESDSQKEETQEENQRFNQIWMMLRGLPDEEDSEFENLSEWEQEFVSSIREQFERKGTLSINQEERLEEIYAKYQS